MACKLVLKMRNFISEQHFMIEVDNDIFSEITSNPHLKQNKIDPRESL